MREVLHFRLRAMLPALLAAVLFTVAAYSPAQVVPEPQVRGAKRLILKDGSYQVATKWEIKGARVRYYSAERSEWEEIPKDLVDWPATEKWERERASGQVSQETREISEEMEAERRAEEAKTPTVAPGIKLPSNGGVFLLDHYQHQPQLVELVQNGGEIKKDMGKNILRAALNPFSSVRQSIELQGTRARVQSHELRPAIFVEVEQDTAAGTGEKPLPLAQRFRLVRLQTKKDTRVVGNLKIALTGKVSQQQNFLETVSQPFSGEWLKVTPAADLQPGEYALVEMLGEKQINLYVWDFGVDPAALANPTAWKPAPVRPASPGADESPELSKRPR